MNPAAVRAALLPWMAAVVWIAAPSSAIGQQEDTGPPGRCPAESGGAEAHAVVRGAVRDASTALPLPGARVHAWRLAVRDSPSTEIRTDSAGRYRVCGFAAGIELGLRAVLGSGQSGGVEEVRLSAAGEPPVTRDLSVDLGRPGEVLGRVRDAADDAPVGAASVILPGLGLRTVTSNDGRFEFPPLPPGRYEARVEHVGHGVHSDTISVRSGRTVRLRMRITRDPVRLAPLQVEIRNVRSMRLDRVGFYDRRKRGHGTFITREELEEWNTSRLSEAFRRVQSFSVGGDPIRRHQYSNRDLRASTRSGPCRTQYFVNGEAQPLPNGIDTFLPADVAALEIYRGSAQLPVEFNRRSASCGAVVVWLRTELGRNGG